MYGVAMAIIATEWVETKRDERRRRITRAAEREALVQAYEESGLTQKAFAKQEGVKYTTFVSWVQESADGGARGQRWDLPSWHCREPRRHSRCSWWMGRSSAEATSMTSHDCCN